MFDEILAECLEALATGATIRDCLRRYPAEASALEPLLRLVVALGREGETRLSADAFTQGRRRLLSAARARQTQAKRNTEIRHRQSHDTLPTPLRRTPFPPYPQNGRPLPPRTLSAKPAQWRVRMPRLLRVALVLLALVGATTLTRHVATSLPGTWLYPVKVRSERMVGVFMTAAGEEIAWRENQIEWRLAELAGLTDASATTVQSVTQSVESDWQTLLTASEGLSANERIALLQAQITRFRKLETSWVNRQTAAPPAAVMTVRKLIAAGEAALATPTPVEEVTPVAATATPTLTPTAFATATPAITPTALLQPSATAPEAPMLEPSPTPAPSPTLAPATAIPVPPSPTALSTPLPEITVQMPRQEASDQEPKKHKKKDDGTASGAEAPTATPSPLIPEATETDAATVTPVVGTGPEEGLPTPTPLSTEAAATPPPANETPTITSGEGTLPLPTKSVAPATATLEPVVTNAARPTNQPSATKTPKATATQPHTEPTTPSVPTAAPVMSPTSATPSEKTPNATAQVPIATRGAATDTPVVASPTPRATTANGEATKTPQP